MLKSLSGLVKFIAILAIGLSLFIYFYMARSPSLNNQKDLEAASEGVSKGIEAAVAIKTTHDSAIDSSNQPPDVQIDYENNELTTDEIEDNCDPASQFSVHLEQEYIELLNEMLGFDFTSTLHNEYQTYDEDTLLVLADSGDSKAMIMLGFNYRWYARFESFKTQIFSMHIQQKPKIRQQINLDYIRQSNHWFDQAAFHGLPNAFLEKESNYALLIEHNQPDPVINEEQQKHYSKVMPVLMQWIMPQHKNIMSTAQVEDIELGDTDNQLLSSLKKQWTEKRTRLNLPITIRFNYSPELESALNHFSNCSKKSNK